MGAVFSTVRSRVRKAVVAIGVSYEMLRAADDYPRSTTSVISSSRSGVTRAERAARVLSSTRRAEFAGLLDARGLRGTIGRGIQLAGVYAASFEYFGDAKQNDAKKSRVVSGHAGKHAVGAPGCPKLAGLSPPAPRADGGDARTPR